jgi:4-hydroxy-tetrahydrodipicolinate synthase
VWPVALTPFRATGEVDWQGVDALVDWYLDAGAAGLFAVCLSSEMYALTPQERLQRAERMVARSAGRVPVVAAGAFGPSLRRQAEMAKRLAATGLTAVVITANQLAAQHESDDVWRHRAANLFDLCPDIPLGLYECPKPYHRTLTPQLAGWAAQTERVLFYKDTCCSLPVIREKLRAVAGTPLAWFNAHAPTLLDSLNHGGCGYSSVAANFIPELYAWLCKHYSDQPEIARRLQAFLTHAQDIIRPKYPAGAKQYLQRAGLPITAVCRVRTPALDHADMQRLDSLRDEAEQWRQTLDVAVRRNDTNQRER